MAVVKIGSTVTANANATSVTASYTQAAGTNRVLVVMVASNLVGFHTGVTFGGTPLTHLTTRTNGNFRICMWYLVNPTVTTANIVASASASGRIAITAFSYSGVDQNIPLGNPNTTAATGTALSMIASSNPASLVIDGFVHSSTATGTVGAGQTSLSDFAATNLRMGTSSEAGMSEVTMSWTRNSSGTWAYVAATLNDDSFPASRCIERVGTDTLFTHSSDNGTYSFSFNHTLVGGAHRLIMVAVGGETFESVTSPAWDVTSMTYGGVNMTRAIRGFTTENGTNLNNNTSEIWYIREADLPADGSKTVQVNGTATGTVGVRLFGQCTELINVDQDTFDSTDDTAFNQTVPSDTISNDLTISNQSWVLSSYVSGNGGTSWGLNLNQVGTLDQADGSGTTRFGVAFLVDANGPGSLVTPGANVVSATFNTNANRLSRVGVSVRSWRKINGITKVAKVNGVPRLTLGHVNKVC